MSATIYIEKLKKLRKYQDLAKGFLKSGVIAFVLSIVWFVVVDEQKPFSTPYAVEEIISLTLGGSVLFSLLLFLLALVYFLVYRLTLRNYGTDMNDWMDQLGEEGMAEVFAGKGKHVLCLILSILVTLLILGFGSFRAIVTNNELKEASQMAQQRLEDVFPGAEILVDKWDDEYEVTVNEITDDLYKSYDFEYILGTDYLDPYNQSYYASFYLSDFTAEEIALDLETHIEKIQNLYYPPGTDTSVFKKLINGEFLQSLAIAAADPAEEHSAEFQHVYVVDGKEVTIYLNIDVHNSEYPEYHNITLSYYSYCWED